MKPTDKEIIDFLVSEGYYGKAGMQKAAKVYAKHAEDEAKETVKRGKEIAIINAETAKHEAIIKANQTQIEALKVESTLLNERISRDILADIVKQSETLPTLQECADFIGMRFTSVNILPLSHKMTLRYGIREMKRAKNAGEII